MEVRGTLDIDTLFCYWQWYGNAFICEQVTFDSKKYLNSEGTARLKYLTHDYYLLVRLLSSSMWLSVELLAYCKFSLHGCKCLASVSFCRFS